MEIRFKNTFIVAGTLLAFNGFTQQADSILLKDYRPVSIYRIPYEEVAKASFPVVDMHSHDYARNDQEIKAWIDNMDRWGIEKTIILSDRTGAAFDSLVGKYAAYKDRSEIWCGFDYTGYDGPDWPANALKELERCHLKGARGVGEDLNRRVLHRP